MSKSSKLLVSPIKRKPIDLEKLLILWNDDNLTAKQIAKKLLGEDSERATRSIYNTMVRVKKRFEKMGIIIPARKRGRKTGKNIIDWEGLGKFWKAQKKRRKR